MRVVGARPDAPARGEDRLPGIVNYLIGSDPSRWKTNIPTYRRVRYAAVYPGIDLVYYGNRRQLEYDFVVAPNADPGRIRVQFPAARSMRVDREGNLRIDTAHGTLVQNRPRAYQQVDGVAREVQSRYVLASGVRFELGEYDRSRPLIIDPVLVSAGFLGGAGADQATGVAVDYSGYTYVTGTTDAGSFPTLAGGFRTAHPGGGIPIGYVTKLNQPGSALLYSTYIGGTAGSTPTRIAVDGSGFIYVGGQTTSTDFPVTGGSMPFPAGAASAGFVTRLNVAGTGLVYSTFIPFATVQDIAVDPGNRAYITGQAAPGFPTTNGAFRVNPPQNGSGQQVAGPYVAALPPTGPPFSYATFLGSAAAVTNAIVVDAAGSAYVTGRISAGDLPTTAGSFQPAFAIPTAPGNSARAFVTKLAPNGSSLAYSTYLGGASSGGEEAMGIGVDFFGNAWVTGATYSADFPVTAGALQASKATPAGDYQLFVSRLNASGGGLLWSTYYGGTQRAVGADLKVVSQVGLHQGVVIAGWSVVDSNTAGFPSVSPLLPVPVASPTTATRGVYVLLDATRNVQAVQLVSSGMAGSAVLTGCGWGWTQGPFQGRFALVGTATQFPTTTSQTFQPNFGGGASDAVVVLGTQPVLATPPLPMTVGNPALIRGLPGIGIRFALTEQPPDGGGTERVEVSQGVTGPPSTSVIARLAAGSQVFTDPAIRPGTIHRYVVDAINQAVAGVARTTLQEFLIPTSPRVGPAAPDPPVLSNPTLVQTSNGQVPSFLIAPPAGGDLVYGFNLYKSVDGAPFALLGNLGVRTDSHTDSAVQATHSYQYRVTAVNRTGESAASNVLTFNLGLQPPLAPTLGNPTLNGSGASVSVSFPVVFPPSSAPVTQLAIHRRPYGGVYAEIARIAVSGSSVAVIDGSVQAGNHYYYTVNAINASGTSPTSNEIQITTTPGVPNPPRIQSRGLVTTGTNTVAPSLSTDGSSAGPATTQLNLYRSADGAAFALHVTFPGSSAVYTDTSALPGHNYRYRATAVGSGGESFASTVLTFDVPAQGLPPVLSNPRAVPQSNLATASDLRFDIAPPSSGAPNAYNLYFSMDGGAFTRSAVALPGNATSGSYGGVAQGHRYRIYLTSQGASGESAPSNVLDFDAPLQAFWPLLANQALIRSGGRLLPYFTIALRAGGAPTSRINLARSIDGGPFIVFAYLPPDRVSHTDGAAQPGHRYAYNATATTTVGESPASPAVIVDVPPLPPDPPVLGAPVLINNGGRQVPTFSITLPSTGQPVTSFLLYRSVDGGAFAQLGSFPTTTVAHTDGSVQPGHTYRYRATTKGPTGESDPSNVISIAMPAVPAPVLGPAGLTFVGGIPVPSFSITPGSGSSPAGYDLNRSVDGGAFALHAQLPGTQTAFTDSSATLGHSYRYRAIATSPAGNSAPSNIVGATVPAAVPGAPILGAPSLTRSGTRLIPTFSIVLSAGGPAVTQIQLARSVDGGAFVVFATFPPHRHGTHRRGSPVRTQLSVPRRGNGGECGVAPFQRDLDRGAIGSGRRRGNSFMGYSSREQPAVPRRHKTQSEESALGSGNAGRHDPEVTC